MYVCMYVCITYIYNLWKNYTFLNVIDSKRIPRVVAFKVIICILEKQASCTLLAISLPGPLKNYTVFSECARLFA